MLRRIWSYSLTSGFLFTDRTYLAIVYVDWAVFCRIFGFVARKTGSGMDNVCHLFAEHDPEQPASAIVNFVSKVMIGSQKNAWFIPVRPDSPSPNGPDVSRVSHEHKL